MSQAYMSQVQPFAFNFAPKAWALCSGTILSIAQNTAMFALLGTTYGGNGVNTFALPNLQSRVPLHMGNYQGTNFTQGEVGGVEQVTLNIANLPIHNHMFMGSNQQGTAPSPADGSALATASSSNPYYGPASPAVALNPQAIATVGGNLPHTNLQPYLALNWCICMQGIFPSRN